MSDPPRSDWSPTTRERRPWRQSFRGGTKEDRMFSAVEAAVPPLIAARDYRMSGDLLIEAERALVEIGGLDSAARGSSAEVMRFMTRTESVASSKIERVDASIDDLARAIAGSKANEAALSMVSASKAIGAMVDAAGEKGRIELSDILAAHHTLMIDDPLEGRYAGTVREVQNWIGGSDYSPRNAAYVPPDPARVPELLDDLIAFCNRDDVPVIAQTAIAHAQFETIHPFGDGNGRVGRALIGAILRRRGITRRSTVPIASGLKARRADYFACLVDYREGRVAPLLALVARAAATAADEGSITVGRIRSLPSEWAMRLGARVDSAATALLPALYSNPVMTAAQLERAAGASPPQVYAAIRRLEEVAIVHEITGRRRDRVWVASDILAEVEDVDHRIGLRMNEPEERDRAD